MTNLITKFVVKNYIKIAFRNFKRHKSSFFINIVGLSIGIACSILIMLWVVDELRYDKFHADINQVYQVMEHQNYSDRIGTTISTPGILAPALKEEIPDIEYASTYTWQVNFLFTKGDKSWKERGIYARPDIFKILTIPLISGNIDKLLESPRSVVISEELAAKYFEGAQAVGESITINGDELHTVTGIFHKLPENSTIQFDYVLPFKDWLAYNEWGTTWGSNGPRTIVKLVNNVDVSELNIKIRDFIRAKEDSNVDLFVYPFADRYLYGSFENGQLMGGRIEYVRLFSIVAMFILLIACINFINLSTAKASLRAKEIGVRKSIGASRGSLISQFISESMIITFFSLILSMIMVQLVMPVFNNLTDKSIVIDYTHPLFLSGLLVTALLTGLLAGGYPAFYLSSFEAIKTLKGRITSKSGELFARKGLVVFQFTMSVILIISSLVVYRQIQYVQTRNLGYDKENLVRFALEGDARSGWDAFKNQMASIPGVQNISRSNSSFLGRSSTTSGLNWPNKDPATQILFENISSDHGLIETLGFELLDGRTFSEEFGADTARIIINQKAAKVMNLENPVGEYITLWGDQVQIIGLVKDFHFRSLRSEISPLFFRLTDSGYWAYARTQSDNIQRTLNEMEEVYKTFNPIYPFDYKFRDQEYETLYRSEQRIGGFAKYFSIFAVIISCLGLFGLSAFTAERRAKEIGVRKVLGASVQNLVLLLTKDFTKLVVAAILIAIPFSWWMMNLWLSDFAYQIQLQWWMFMLAAVLALLVSWLTVSWQSIKAALANPVDSLSSE